MALNGYMTDDDKFNALKVFIEPETYNAVASLIYSPTRENKYETLMSAIIKAFTDSETKNIHKLLPELQLGDRCPTHRHTRAPLQQYQITSQRFEHINIDLIGPLPLSNGKRYCLTIIDRFSRWPEAISVSDMTATTIVKCLVRDWISIKDASSNRACSMS